MVRSSLGRGITTLSILFFSTMGILAVGPASATSTWGTAQEVGASLNTQNQAVVLSISCSSVGNCSAGGYYRDSVGYQAFVVDEVGGTWGAAQEVGASLNTQNNAQVNSISCSSAGSCSAGGQYTDSAGAHAFVIDEVGGTWGVAQKAAASLNTQGGAQVNSISCSSTGNCSAGGSYGDSAGVQAFVVDEVGGTWGTAQEVAALLTINTNSHGSVSSISCSSTGNCSAGGRYSNGLGYQVFVVDEVGGTWGTAQEVAASLNTQYNASMTSISCSSTGNCSAGGLYADSAGAQAFVIDEVSGTWGTAQEVAASLNTKNNAQVNSISCSSVGSCSAGGQYTDRAGIQAFVVEATTPVTPTTTVPTTVPATPTTTPLTTTPAMTTSASLAATGTNLTLPLGLAAVFLGVGGVGILESWRRRRRA